MDRLDSNWLAAQIERIVDAPVGSTSIITDEHDAEKARQYLIKIRSKPANLQNLSGTAINIDAA